MTPQLGTTDTSVPGETTRRAETARALLTPLTSTLVGEVLTLDWFARIPFRFLGVPAWADAETLTARSQRFRNLARVSASLARGQAIATIGDQQVDSAAIVEEVSRLENPRRRFVAELFWPHVDERRFVTIAEAADMRSPAITHAFASDGHGDLECVLSLHVLALAAHCRAMEAEIDSLEGSGMSAEGLWEEALGHWRRVWSSETFWKYLRRRVELLDDPRLIDQDVDRSRAELPAVLLGFQEVFAERYGAQADYGNCVRHLNLIRESGFPVDIVRASTWNAVKKVAGAGLDDLQQRVRQAISGMSECTRRSFAAAIEPFIREGEARHRLLADKLQLSPEFFEQSAFDAVADQIQRAANKKIRYSGDDRERSLVYSSTLSRQLLRFPLSSATRRSIEQSIREDNRHLYGQYGFEPAACPEALKCFFIEDADADPDACLVVPMYRVTDREVTVNRTQGSAGIRATIERVRLLIPRSKLAQKHPNGGQVEIQVAESDYTPEHHTAALALKEQEGEHRRNQDRLRAAADKDILKAEQKRDAHLASESARIDVQLTSERTRLQQDLDAEALAIRNEKQRLKGETARVEASHAPSIKSAIVGVAARRHDVSAISLALLALPLAAATGVGLWLLFNNSGAAVIGGVALAVVFCAARRSAVLSSAEKAVAAARGALESERSALATASGRTEKEIHKAGEARRRGLNATIGKLEAERQQLKQTAQQQVDHIRKAGDEKQQQADRAFEVRVKPLRLKFSRTVRAKRESQKTEFAGYRAARAKGYKDGKEPPPSEMQLTDAERMRAMVMLRLER